MKIAVFCNVTPCSLVDILPASFQNVDKGITSQKTLNFKVTAISTSKAASAVNNFVKIHSKIFELPDGDMYIYNVLM
jgi:hypothetical protein